MTQKEREREGGEVGRRRGRGEINIITWKSRETRWVIALSGDVVITRGARWTDMKNTCRERERVREGGREEKRGREGGVRKHERGDEINHCLQ